MRFERLLRVSAGLVAGACAIGCGGSSGGSAVEASTQGEGGPEAGDAHAMDVVGTHPDASAPDTTSPDATGPTDGGTDANVLAVLGACLGTSQALTISGQMPYANVPVGTEMGEFVLDFGSTFSSIDLTAFASPGPMTSGCDSSELGQICMVADFAFFDPPSTVELTTEDFSDVGGSVRQAGIIGTDFLSEHVITLAYGADLVFASPSSSFCSEGALEAAGFAPFTTTGFYENDLSLLEPAKDVDSNASSGITVPNVPTVNVAVAGVAAIAQLDTGFDDDVTPFSVNINQAFYSAIVAASPSALTRDASLDTTLTTCIEDVNEPVTAYTLAAPTTFDFVANGGTVARSYTTTVLFVKDTPMAAESCGGIGTWTVPAAQVAASYYNDMKVIVFDPYGARVWIPKG
jgi:hypothetical protein